MQSLLYSLATFSVTYGLLEFLFKLVQDLLSDAIREWAKKSPLVARLLILLVAFGAYVMVVKSHVEAIIPQTPPVQPVPSPDKRPPQQPAPSVPTPIPPSIPAPAPAPVRTPPAPKPRVVVTLDSALAPYKKDIEGILDTIPLRNGHSVNIAMNMETYSTPDMPGAEPATINIIVDATAIIKNSSGSAMKTISPPKYKVTQPLKIITNTDAYIRDRVISATKGFKNTLSEEL
ncbi:MAG: hypothetical protein ACLGSA_15240 [Acidobacteriota bacterium]